MGGGAIQLEETHNSLEIEAVGEVRRLDVFPIPEDTGELHIPPSEAVRSVVPLADKQRYAISEEPWIVLYRNVRILRGMHNRLAPDLVSSEDVLERLAILIRSSHNKIISEDIEEVDQLVLRPTAEWILSAETGTEFDFKWSLASDRSIDNVVFMLLAALPTKDIDELHRQLKEQQVNASGGRSVYPGMLIKARGVIRGQKDLTAQRLRLRTHRCLARVQLEGRHSLAQEIDLLRKHHIYVLGIIQSVKELTIKAGAVLLGASVGADEITQC